MTTTVGFIGLGHMGQPMAANLLKAGYTLMVYDVVPQCGDELVNAGAIRAESPLEVARSAQVIFTMLQTGEQVTSVSLGEKGLFDNVNPNTLLIDCSSIDLETTHALFQEAKQRGLSRIDAPVSGGVKGATAATLTVMVGGTETAVQQAMPYLCAIGKKIIHAGASGTGQVAKMCNNMILGISMIAVSEAYILGERLGLSPEKLFEIASQSSGQCWAMTQYSPVPGLVDNVPANRGYEPGFTADMMLKDLSLAQEGAELANLQTPLGKLAKEIYDHFVEAGFGKQDFSGIIQHLSK